MKLGREGHPAEASGRHNFGAPCRGQTLESSLRPALGKRAAGGRRVSARVSAKVSRETRAAASASRAPGAEGAGRPSGAGRFHGGGSPGISRSGENAEPDAPSPKWGSRGLCPPRGPPRAAQVTGTRGWVLEGPSKPGPRPAFLGPPASFLLALDP